MTCNKETCAVTEGAVCTPLCKNHKPDTIKVLLVEYFANRKEINSIKQARVDHWANSEVGCQNQHAGEYEKSTCFEIDIGLNGLCDFCVERNRLSNKIHALVARNRGIMNSLRSKCKI